MKESPCSYCILNAPGMWLSPSREMPRCIYTEKELSVYKKIHFFLKSLPTLQEFGLNKELRWELDSILGYDQFNAKQWTHHYQEEVTGFYDQKLNSSVSTPIQNGRTLLSLNKAYSGEDLTSLQNYFDKISDLEQKVSTLLLEQLDLAIEAILSVFKSDPKLGIEMLMYYLAGERYLDIGACMGGRQEKQTRRDIQKAIIRYIDPDIQAKILKRV